MTMSTNLSENENDNENNNESKSEKKEEVQHINDTLHFHFYFCFYSHFHSHFHSYTFFSFPWRRGISGETMMMHGSVSFSIVMGHWKVAWSVGAEISTACVVVAIGATGARVALTDAIWSLVKA
jgi:hypothetical protein